MSQSVAHKLSTFKPGLLYVGIDLALESNEVQVIDEQARVVAHFAFRNSVAGYEELARRLPPLVQRQQASGVVVGMEPTNYYWSLLAADLERREVRYQLVNAFTVHRHREGDQLDTTKTDARDAFTIADLLRTGKFTHTQLLHGDYAALRHYAVLYDRLVHDATRTRVLLHNAVGQVFPELTEVFKDLTGQTARALLSQHASAWTLRQLGEEEFLAAVSDAFPGQRLAVRKLRQAYQLAGQSIGLREGLEALQLTIQGHLETWQVLRRQAAQAQEALRRTFQALPEAPYLCSLHGLGETTAAIILAEIGDPSHYQNGRQLVKLAGIQPTPHRSGQHSHGPTPLSGKGRARLRRILYLACLRLIQVDEAFAQAYRQYQERAQNPLRPMQALGALMNQLLLILWALMHQRTVYDPTRWARAA